MSKTIKIDGVDYVPKSLATGKRHIVVLDRGWIFVGDLTARTDGNGSRYLTLSNAANVRKWTSGGFGGLTSDPKGSGAVLDPCEDLKFDDQAPLFIVPVEDGWGG